MQRDNFLTKETVFGQRPARTKYMDNVPKGDNENQPSIALPLGEGDATPQLKAEVQSKQRFSQRFQT
jgi:hypothetical protein